MIGGDPVRRSRLPPERDLRSFGQRPESPDSAQFPSVDVARKELRVLSTASSVVAVQNLNLSAAGTTKAQQLWFDQHEVKSCVPARTNTKAETGVAELIKLRDSLVRADEMPKHPKAFRSNSRRHAGEVGNANDSNDLSDSERNTRGVMARKFHPRRPTSPAHRLRPTRETCE